MSNELGRLAQGNKYGAKATDTIDFITKTDIPTTSKVTYTHFVCDYKPLKTEQRRIKLVAGGYTLEFDGDAGALAALLIEKCYYSTVLSQEPKITQDLRVAT